VTLQPAMVPGVEMVFVCANMTINPLRLPPHNPSYQLLTGASSIDGPARAHSPRGDHSFIGISIAPDNRSQTSKGQLARRSYSLVLATNLSLLSRPVDQVSD